MEGKRVATRIRHRATYTGPLIGNRMRPRHNGPVEWKDISKREITDRVRETRVGTLKNQVGREVAC